MVLWRYEQSIKQLGERYTLMRQIGSGGMADVCLAWDEHEYRELAVKVLKPDEIDPKWLGRFLKEGALVSKLRHKHIIRVYGDGVQFEDLSSDSTDSTQRIPYIVMEYVRGGNLKKRLIPETPYTLRNTLQIFGQLCNAVHYAHTQGILHRDIKPHNILFRPLPNGTEQAVLSDFGLAVLATDTHYTYPHGGTLAYMAPEQRRGHPQFESDIFALGVLLYQLCTGHLPAVGSTPPIHPDQLNPNLPPGLGKIILTALAEDPALRFHDAYEFWEHIRAAVSHNAQTTTARTQLMLPSDINNNIIVLPHVAPQSPNPARPVTNPSPQLTSSSPSQVQPTPPAAPQASSIRNATNADSALQPDTPNASAAKSDPRQTRQFTAIVPEPPTASYSLSSPDNPPIPRYASTVAPSSADQTPSIRRTTASNLPSTPTPSINRPQPTIHNASPRKRSGLAWSISIAALVLLLLVGALATYFNPTLLSHLSIQGLTSGSVGATAAPATVSITPKGQKLADTFAISAVTDNPDANTRQVALRNLTFTTPTKTQKATATGEGGIPGTNATGQLTFFNNSPTSLTVASNTIFTLANGVKIENDQPATIPAGNPPTEGSVTVPAHALTTGSAGNIAAQAIFTSCCTGGVTVKNTVAFTGGQDGQQYTFLQQSDIDAAVNAVRDTLNGQGKAGITQQTQANEKLLGDIQCNTPDVNTDQSIGDNHQNVTSANVSVTITCTGQTYDFQSAQKIATTALQTEATKNLGDGYVLAGSVVPQAPVVTTNDKNVTLNVTAQGVWYYPFSAAQQQAIAKHIKGMSSAEALNWLKQQPGVASVKIDATGDGTQLPTDWKQIKLSVAPVTGLSTTPGSTGTSTGTNPGGGSTPATTSGSQSTPTNGNDNSIHGK